MSRQYLQLNWDRSKLEIVQKLESCVGRKSSLETSTESIEILSCNYAQLTNIKQTWIMQFLVAGHIQFFASPLFCTTKFAVHSHPIWAAFCVTESQPSSDDQRLCLCLLCPNWRWVSSSTAMDIRLFSPICSTIQSTTKLAELTRLSCELGGQQRLSCVWHR